MLQNTLKNLKVSAYLLANVFFSITIILLNKWIYSHAIFPNITLSMIHFIVTFLGLCVCEKLNVFNVKSVHLSHLIFLALCFCGFVVFTNLSLEYNSVGTFQVAKMLTTPGVVLIQILYYRKYFSLPVKLTLVKKTVHLICNRTNTYFFTVTDYCRSCFMFFVRYSF